MQVERITAEEGLRDLLPEWRSLWRESLAATPFQWPGWLMCWWHHYGTGRPVVLTARNGGRLVAVLPLYQRDEPGCRKLLPIGVALSDYIDVLAAPEAPEAADRLMAEIAATPGWDECFLPGIAADSALARAACPADLIEAPAAGTPCPVLNLRGAAGLAAVAPRKTMRDLHQARARAAAAGAVRIETVAADTLDTAMHELFRLHEARWRDRGESGVCDDPIVRGFHLCAARSLASAGMLRLYQWSMAETVLAVYYGFTAKGTAYAYLGGFDPAAPRLSPGTQIIAHAIEQAIGEGAHSFDFLRGAEAYKYAWGAVDRGTVVRRLRPRGR
ncbi:MAG: GNAT family N-acetyltransferase [Alphaproteobacteria bacterium]|nr:GNAT family N-acetyltransferase [Alphaproteobacteria bacterium]